MISLTFEYIWTILCLKIIILILYMSIVILLCQYLCFLPSINVLYLWEVDEILWAVSDLNFLEKKLQSFLFAVCIWDVIFFFKLIAFIHLFDLLSIYLVSVFPFFFFLHVLVFCSCVISFLSSAKEFLQNWDKHLPSTNRRVLSLVDSTL